MKKRWIVSGAILLVIFVVVAGVIKWASGPAVATITPATTGDVKGESVGLQEFRAAYFNTKVPDIFKLKTRTETDKAPIYGQYLFVGKETYNPDQVAITVGKAANSALDDISLVKFRLSYPSEYEQSPPDAGFPEGSMVFVKKSSYEKAVFWKEDSSYVGIVASGTADHRPELENAIQTMVANWHWTQTN